MGFGFFVIALANAVACRKTARIWRHPFSTMPTMHLYVRTLTVRGIGNVDDLIFKNVSDPLAFRKAIASAMERVSEHHGEASIAVRPARDPSPQTSHAEL